MKNITLKVKGMHCSSCKVLIEDALEDINVLNADANVEAGTVEVSYDEEKINEDAIRKAIENEGYEVG